MNIGVFAYCDILIICDLCTAKTAIVIKTQKRMKKILLASFCLCGALAAHAAPAAAAVQPAEAVAETVAAEPPAGELEARVEALDRRTSAWGKIVSNLPRISGYAQLGYQWDNNSLDHGSNSSFSVMSVRLSLAGDLGRKFDYKVQLEFASFKLIDAFVRYKIAPGFSLQAGQFHTNFSLEGPFGALDMEAITYAPVVSVIAGTPDSRDIGLAAYGAAGRRDGFNLFEYSLGVFNGEGKNKADANKSKDIVGRVKINPVKDLTLSGSYSRGEHGESYVHNDRVAGGVWYHSDTFWARSEYLGLTQKAGGTTAHVDGAYLTAGCWVGSKREHCPLARFSYMDNGLGGSYVQQTELLVGYDYKPLKHLRVQLNYAHSWFSDGAAKHNNNIVGVAVTGSF